MTPQDPAWLLISQFAQGTVDARTFEQALYHDAALAAVLETARPLPDWLPLPDLHTWACSLDLERSEHLLDLRTVLAETLKARGTPVCVAPEDGKCLQALLAAQPAWLSLDGDYLARWQTRQPHLTPTALKAALKAHVASHFVSIARPPRWLQAPAWPISEGKPLVFVGQLALGTKEHDQAFVYVFQSADGAYEMVTQHT